MKLFGRPIKNYLRALLNLPELSRQIYRVFRQFRQPLSFLLLYIFKQLPKSKEITLRNGVKIFLSDDTSDIITIFSIFARRDYGKISPHSTVIDIGANIGVFCIYSVVSGATRVFAFEPSQESFNILKKNIEANRLHDKVALYPYAVWDKMGIVEFPKSSSVMNKVIATSEETPVETNKVPAITFEEILKQDRINKVDLLKIDCEGAEYRIVNSINKKLWKRVDALRLEYHDGDVLFLINYLKQYGFVAEYMLPNRIDQKTGIVYFRNLELL